METLKAKQMKMERAQIAAKAGINQYLAKRRAIRVVL